MNIGFIANYQSGPGGEIADEVHLARELESQGHKVFKIPRDEWREYVIEGGPQNKYKVPEDVKIDICIIAKWHHFSDERFIETLKKKYGCPVFYWVWDYMGGHTLDDWHMKMAKSADLYLSGEIGLAHWYHSNGVKFYYLNFDSTDGAIPAMHSAQKKYDVVYPGSCNNQNGRLDLLKSINEKIKIKVFAYDFEEWIKQGFDASPAVYGLKFNQMVSESKIILGTAAGPRCFGYTSNRVGKVLHAGGFLLQWYVPGMEMYLADSCEYYSTPEEAVEKIKFYLENELAREVVIGRNMILNRDRWTSEYKIRQLLVLMDRYLKDPKTNEWMLP